MRAASLSVVILFLISAGAHAAERTFQLTVAAGQWDRVNVPICVPANELPQLAGARSVTLVDASGQPIPAQLTRPGLLRPAGAKDACELHFIVPRLKAGEMTTLKATFSTEPPAVDGFAWDDRPGEYAELRYGRRPVLRYMYHTFDDSTKEKRDLTFKVFHHLYDPDGTRLVTKGAGGQYPHHRGLFYGYNRISYGGKNADVWHCTGDAHQAHVRFLSVEAGPVLGRHRVEVAWRGPGKETFATELRELTVYHVPGGHLVEFASELRSHVGPVKLDGDPQHAGFHFRADNEVAIATAKQTYFLRPDGPSKPGESRNWPADKNHVNLPWNAMSFVLGGQRYTCAYLDRPDNPKEARFSERPYGRFGSYFPFELNEKQPVLAIRYRLWLQKGEMTVPQVSEHSTNFVHPPAVTVKK
jgi:hypothetical protein